MKSRVNPTPGVGNTGAVDLAGALADGHARDRLTWQKRLAWSGLPTGARCIGLVLALYTDEHGQMAIWLTLTDLHRLTGLSVATVRRYLAILEQAGWIARLGRSKGHPTARFLAWPGELPADPGPVLAEAAALVTTPGGEHFPGCHPEDAEARREAPEGYQIELTERCWHCGTPTTRGACRCPDCMSGDDYIPVQVVYHCTTCGRWWAWMTGLNVVQITLGKPGGAPSSTQDH